MQTISEMIALIERRARAYVDKMPAAISGQGGHEATFRVAVALARGFALPENTVLSILQEYNQRCEPPWKPHELKHKAKDACEKSTLGCGYLLDAERPYMQPEEATVSDELVAAMIAEDEARQHRVAVDVQPNPVAEATRLELAKVREERAIEKVKQSEDAEEDAAREMLQRVVGLGGLCGSFPKWVDESSIYQRPALAVAATIAMGSALFGRRVVTETGLGLSLYVIAAADTAAGKDRPGKCLQQALAGWPEVRGPGGFSSFASTLERIKTTTVAHGCGLLFNSDEFGEKFSTMTSSKTGHQSEILSLILQLSTVGTGIYSTAQSLARGGQDVTIDAPCVSIYGASTPESLDSIFTIKNVRNGVAGRFLLSLSRKRLPKRNRSHHRHLRCPDEVAAGVAKCLEAHKLWAGPPGARLASSYPVHVTRTDAASDLFEQIFDEVESIRQDARDKTKSALYGRVLEKVEQVSTILACLSEISDLAVVEKAHVEIAHQYVLKSIKDIEDICGEASGRESLTPQEEVSRVASWLKTHAVPATKSEILRGCRFVLSGKLGEALRTLEDRESITKHTSADALGRPVVSYLWNN